MYPASALTATDMLDFDFQPILVATGAKWRADGVARQHVTPPPAVAAMPVFPPDNLMERRTPLGRVVIYDDDHSYMDGALCAKGL